MTTKKRINNITKFLLILFLSTLLVLTGCSTPSYSTFDYDYPIGDIQRVVTENLPSGLGATNSNKRVLYSKKFTVPQEKKKPTPLVMRVVINGDRRPYGLDFEVKQVSPDIKNIEEAFNFGSDFRGQDSLAKRVAIKVKDQLAQRRKNKNIFDDFKAF